MSYKQKYGRNHLAGEIMLRVFNVGQADSFELVPRDGCKFEDSSILIDCGQGSRNVFGDLSKDKVNLVLSHAHKDHIGGLGHLFGGRSRVQVEELWLPYYSDEIVKIANFIFSLKGVSSIIGCTKAELELRNTVNTYRVLQEILSGKGCKVVRGVGKGLEMCAHLSILNPPLDPDYALCLKKGTSEKYWEHQKQTNYETIKRWLTPEEFERNWGSFIAEGWDYSVPNLIEDENLSFRHRMQFIYGFFYKYEPVIEDFIESSAPRDFDRIVNAVKLTSNDISVVLEYEFDDFSCLLTGDVSRTQLINSLSDRKNSRINIFKFPHHGSKTSLDRRVLRKLSPEIVIISHGNGRFGKQKDPHPNLEVIQALDEMNIPTAYTNDVVKDGRVMKKKSIENPHKYVEVVELYH